MEINNLLDKEFKAMVLKILTKFSKRMHDHRENFNKKTENIRSYQIEVLKLKNIITELKNILEKFNIRLDEAKKGSMS